MMLASCNEIMLQEKGASMQFQIFQILYRFGFLHYLVSVQSYYSVTNVFLFAFLKKRTCT